MFKKILAFALAMALAAIVICSCSSENSNKNIHKQVEGNVNEVILKEGDTYAVISIKDYGDITIKLFPDAAPKAVEVFTKLANDGFYDGKNFHRIMKDFMAQAGKADNEKEHEQFDIETNVNCRHFYGALSFANALGKNSTQFYIVNSKKTNDLNNYNLPKLENYTTMYKQKADTISDKNSTEYKYYIHQSEYYGNMKTFVEEGKADSNVLNKYKEKGGSESLDGNYTVFGQTVDGFDVLDAISSVELKENALYSNEVSAPVTDVIIDTVKIMTYHE